MAGISKEGRDTRKGQMWSVDVIIGIVIFISVITVFYTTLSETGSDVRENLKANADTIETKFAQNPNYRVISEGNVLNQSRLEELSQMDYDALKEDLGIEGDFCIYVEDEEGRLVPIGGKSSFGKSAGETINVSSGHRCGSSI